MPDYVIDNIENAGQKITITDQLEDNLDQTDILYLTRIQEGRFPSQEKSNKYRGKFRLNRNIYTQHCKSNTVIMHPPARDSRKQANEMDNDPNRHPKLAIFRQADNGLLTPHGAVCTDTRR